MGFVRFDPRLQDLIPKSASGEVLQALSKLIEERGSHRIMLSYMGSRQEAVLPMLRANKPKDIEWLYNIIVKHGDERLHKQPEELRFSLDKELDQKL